MTALNILDKYYLNIDKIEELNKDIDNNRNEIYKYYYETSQYKECLNIFGKLQNPSIEEEAIFIKCLYYNQQFNEVVNFYNAFSSNQVFNKLDVFRFFVKSYYKIKNPDSKHLYDLFNEYSTLNEKHKIDIILEVISSQISFIPAESNLFACQQFLGNFLIKNKEIYSYDNIDKSISLIKDGKLNLINVFIQFLYLNNEVIQSNEFHKYEYFLDKFIENNVSNYDILVEFIENVQKSPFYLINDLVKNKNYINKIKSIYKLDYCIETPNTYSNIAIVTLNTSLTMYQYWKLATIKGFYRFDIKQQIYLFSQKPINIMDKQTYLDYKGIPFSNIIHINNNIKEFNNMINKYKIGKIILLDIIDDNFQYFIGSNYTNTFSYLHYQSYDYIYPSNCQLLKLFDESYFQGILPYRYNYNQDTFNELNMNKTNNYILLADDILLVSYITLYKLKDILSINNSFCFIFNSNDISSVLIDKLQEIFGIFFPRIFVVDRNSYNFSKYVYFSSCIIALHQTSITPQLILEAIYFNKLVFSLDEIDNTMFIDLVKGSYLPEFFKHSSFEDLISKSVSYSYVQFTLHKLEFDHIENCLNKPTNLSKILIQIIDYNDNKIYEYIDLVNSVKPYINKPENESLQVNTDEELDTTDQIDNIYKKYLDHIPDQETTDKSQPIVEDVEKVNSNKNILGNSNSIITKVLKVFNYI